MAPVKMIFFKNVAVVFLLFNFASLIFGSTSKLNTAVSNLEMILKNDFKSTSDTFGIASNVDLIKIQLSELELDKQHKDSLAIIKRISWAYMMVLDFIENLIKFPSAQNFLSQIISQIVSNICDFRPISSEFLEKETVIYFVFKCQNLVFRVGSVQNFHKLLYDPLDVYLPLKMLKQISSFLTLKENLKENELVLVFYFYYADILSKSEFRDLPAFFKFPKEAILFIDKHQINVKVSENITTWLRIYYRNIGLIFKNPDQDLKCIEILFKMIKGLKDFNENDIDWAVGMFDAPNFKTFIFANQSFLAISMNLLSQLSNLFRQKFNNSMNNLDPFLSLELMSFLYKHELTKKKILASLQLKKSLSDAKLDPKLPPVEAHIKWQLALQDLKRLHFDLLKPEEISNLTETIRKDFLDVSSQYFASNSTNFLFTANAYIPILLKLNISLHPESEKVAKNITRAVANYFYQKYLTFHDEINLNGIKQILIEYHGEVFTENESFLLLSKIITILKLDPFNFKTLWESFESPGLQNTEMLILNLQNRITKYIQSGTRHEDEIKDILEIIEYLELEVKFLSKAQIFCLKSLFSNF